MRKQRVKLPKQKSTRLFKKTSGTNSKNISPKPMRGGYRL